MTCGEKLSFAARHSVFFMRGLAGNGAARKRAVEQFVGCSHSGTRVFMFL